MLPCNLLDRYECSGLSCSARRIEVAGTFETVIPVYKMIQGYHIMEDCNLHIHCNENPKSQSVHVSPATNFCILHTQGRLDSPLER
jgi:hypothetical protein